MREIHALSTIRKCEMEWHFTCGCAMGHLEGRGTLTLEATDEEDASQKARALGWHVDWDGGYPGVACSDACWQRSHDEWERTRPARQAARAERLAAKRR